MADWFKFYENGIHESRFQWAIHEECGVCSVWLWILSECCRTKSDSFPWSGQDFELFGVAQLTNITVPKVNISFNLLKQIKYIEIVDETLKVLKWNKFQSDYMRKLSKTPDILRTHSGHTPDKVGLEERRGEENRENKPEGFKISISKTTKSSFKDTPLGHKWCSAFKQRFGHQYEWQSKDDRAAQKILDREEGWEAVVGWAISAWDCNNEFLRKLAVSLSGFQNNLVRFIPDIGEEKASKPISSKEFLKDLK